MKHSNYINLLRDIAIAHTGIGHTKQKSHFARITLRADPFGGRGYIAEFVNGLRNKHYPLMLAITYHAIIQGENADQSRKVIQGGFIMLDTAKMEDFDQINDVYDNMEAISEQVLSYMRASYEDNSEVGLFDLNGTTMEKIGPVGDNLFGEIVLFPLPSQICRALQINTSNFDASLLTEYHGAGYQLPDFLP